MTTYKDTDLREALRRKYANTPQLPSDFMNRMHKVAQPKKPHSSLFILHSSFLYWTSIAAALLIVFLLWPESHKETTTQQEVQPIVEEKKYEVLAEVQPTPQPVKKRQTAARKQSTPVEPVQAGPELSSESLPHQEDSSQPSNGEGIDMKKECSDEVDSRTRLYAAEIELEKSTHQRQETYEKEMQQRELEILLYLMTDKEDELANGTVNTQKS